MLKTFLYGRPSLLRAFALNNRLMLIGNKLRYYLCCFTSCFIILFFSMKYCINENIYYELCSSKFVFNKALWEGFDCRPLSLLDNLLTFLLPKLIHSIAVISWIVCWATNDQDWLILSFFFIWHVEFEIFFRSFNNMYSR